MEIVYNRLNIKMEETINDDGTAILAVRIGKKRLIFKEKYDDVIGQSGSLTNSVKMRILKQIEDMEE